MHADTVATALDPWGNVSRCWRASGGIRNDVFHVVIDGVRRVARVGRRSGRDLEWELELLSFLACEGFNVPTVVPTSDGRERADSIVVFDYITGRPPRTPSDWLDVGRYLGNIHAATSGWPQRPTWRATRELPDATVSGVVDLSTLPSLFDAVCRESFAHLRQGMCVIHGDPNSRNVIIGPGGLTLIDWDEARVDDPALDGAAIGLDDARARTARSAWEAAACWRDAPPYARWQLVRAVGAHQQVVC